MKEEDAFELDNHNHGRRGQRSVYLLGQLPKHTGQKICNTASTTPRYTHQPKEITALNCQTRLLNHINIRSGND